MTYYTSGDEPLSADGIHAEPEDDSAAGQRQLQRILRAAGPALLKHFVAQVLYLVAGISIGGVEPFAGLAVWADDLEKQASDALNNAATAQDSANYANSQLTGLLVSDSGGTSLSATFGGAATTTIGSGFVQVYSGPGGGNWGRDGNGNTKWNKTGGVARTCIARHPTPLTTNYQRVRLVITSLPQVGLNGAAPANYVCGRINSACDTFVFIRYSRTSITLGCFVSGSGTQFATTSFTPKLGDVYDLYLGTDVDDREFLVKVNGETLDDLTYTDSGAVSAMGGSNLYVGLGCLATDRQFNTDQSVPGGDKAWGAIDRLATSY